MITSVGVTWHNRIGPCRERVLATTRSRRRRRGWSWGDAWSRCRRLASSQVERTDSQPPSGGACRGDVFVDVPESGVVGWVRHECCVVTPTIAACSLRAGPVLDGTFAESHLARRIAIVSGGVEHARKHTSIRSTETQSDVTQ